MRVGTGNGKGDGGMLKGKKLPAFNLPHEKKSSLAHTILWYSTSATMMYS
jgi:hypothetical protein